MVFLLVQHIDLCSLTIVLTLTLSAHMLTHKMQANSKQHHEVNMQLFVLRHANFLYQAPLGDDMSMDIVPHSKYSDARLLQQRSLTNDRSTRGSCWSFPARSEV